MKWQKKANPFYTSRAWKQARDAALMRDNYLCVRCMERYRQGGCKPRRATLVHHVEPLEMRPDLALVISNLQSLCETCHNQLHPEKGRKGGGEKSEKPLHENVRIIKI